MLEEPPTWCRTRCCKPLRHVLEKPPQQKRVYMGWLIPIEFIVPVIVAIGGSSSSGVYATYSSCTFSEDPYENLSDQSNCSLSRSVSLSKSYAHDDDPEGYECDVDDYDDDAAGND